jgi:hypothetical protein
MDFRECEYFFELRENCMRLFLYSISATVGSLLATEAALAGTPPSVPGPVAAVGAPALLVIGGAFMAVRYLRRSRRK